MNRGLRSPLLLALALLLAGCQPPRRPPAAAAEGEHAAPPPLLPLRDPDAEPATEPSTIEAEMRRVPIAMYMTRWCPVCRRARAWLAAGGYSFVEHDVEVNLRAARILRQHNVRRSVPMFDVDGQMVIGFNPQLLQSAVRRAAERRTTERLGLGPPEPCGGPVAGCAHRR